MKSFFLLDKRDLLQCPKKNPILSENITGLARLVRSYVNPSMENIILWHERDISHSSVERNIGPDATITLDFLLNRLNNVIKNLVVYPNKNEEEYGGFKWFNIFPRNYVKIDTKRSIERSCI